MFYVDISDASDEKLEFFGFRLVYEDEHVRIYAEGYGEEYIVHKGGRAFIMVEDINTARELGNMAFELRRI